MPRRRQDTLWIHRWSRWLIGAIALMGAFGTAYLTVVKVMGGTAACPTGGCDRVLASDYAQVFGIPLTIFGCLGYLSMAALALAPLLVNPDQQKELRRNLETITWPLLFMGATAMVVFSGYLMYLLAFELKTSCLYCITSALFAASMFALSILGRRWEDSGQLVFTGLIVGVITLVGTLAIYAPVNNPQTASTTDIPGETGPPVTTTSGAAEIQLAQHLDDVGATMYGAWWCPHCHDQKQLFGEEAAEEIPYVECAEDGQNPQPDLCRSAGITGFPTWKVDGQSYEGAQPLQRLAEVSGYDGPTNFQN